MKTLKEIENFIIKHEYHRNGNEAICFDKETEKGIEVHIYHNCELNNRHDYKVSRNTVYVYSNRKSKYVKLSYDKLTTKFLQDLTKFVKE
jgi:hypothetical protein|nr:MAG TPA: hypothetical protein [Caudoviricetes sp.]